jgi:NAD(P)-dependent dehydrogenase (short-subunit alcohol dehydrogenase family)
MDLEGAVALVTGGSAGLGLATARRLGAEGACVVVLDVKEPLDRTVLSDTVLFAPTDVTDEGSVGRAIDVAESRFGPIRLLVNCAGGGGNPGKVLRQSGEPRELAHFVDKVQLNLVGTYNVIRLAAAAMLRAPAIAGERGVIVNTSSAAAFEGQVGQVAYAAAKGAVNAMTLPLAREFAPHKIRVIAIAPGIFASERILEAWPEERRAAITADVPHPARLGEPAEFAAMVVSVVANPMVNGTCVRLDGALRLR